MLSIQHMLHVVPDGGRGGRAPAIVNAYIQRPSRCRRASTLAIRLLLCRQEGNAAIRP